jgi:hypothetical protein
MTFRPATEQERQTARFEFRLWVACQLMRLSGVISRVSYAVSNLAERVAPSPDEFEEWKKLDKPTGDKSDG